MELIEVKESERDIYNRFVMENEAGSFLQGYEWGEWQAALGRQIIRYWILDTGREKIGAVQFIKMPLPFGKYYLYAPYGPVVDGKSEILISKFEKIYNILKIKFSEAVFYRFEFKNFSNFDFRVSNLNFVKTKNIQPGKTLVVDLKKTESELLAEMHQKTRYNIRLAEKRGVEIQDEFAVTVGKGIYAKEAIDLIAQTAVRQGYKAQNKGYFEKLASFFAVQNSAGDVRLHVYKALYKKELLASAIIIDFGKTRTYLFGGSSEQNKNLMAPYLLHFRAMLDAKALGLTEYDFWGIETSAGETPGFVRFKLGFSTLETSIKKYAGAYDLVLSRIWYSAYKIFRSLNSVRK